MMTKIFGLSIVVLLLASCNTNKNTKPVIPDGYKLFFEDNFDGDTLNELYWSYQIGDGTPNTGWGNNELEYYRQENVSVKDGKLYITAKRESFGGYEFTSARIRTTGKVFFKYGIVEARISLPAEKAMWPAFWMLPEEWRYGGWPDSGEIDIMEANGGSEYGTSCALHYSISAGSDTYQTGYNNMKKRGEEPSSITEFHVYKLDWQEENISFYVDDRLILDLPERTWSSGTVNKNDNPLAPFDQNFHILLNMAVGGNYVKNVQPDPSFVSADMVVDYVRVYTYDE